MDPSARLTSFFTARDFSLSAKKMGRHAANDGMIDALIDSETSTHFRVLLPTAQDINAIKKKLARRRPALHLLAQRFLTEAAPVDTDVVFMQDPLLGRMAEWRQWQTNSASTYSVMGITHTLCSMSVLEGIRQLVSAPVQPWDALICTSHCAKTAITAGLDWEIERLRMRFQTDAIQVPKPELPIIPLGCHVDLYSSARARREASRQFLGIPADQTVLLFVGRLAVHAKSDLVAMFEALDQIAARPTSARQPIRLLLYGVCPDEQQRALQEAIQCLCRHYDVHVLDGNQEALATHAWACADLFISLADSHQETFGLTPVEAMAAGLPVIASDWNGYRDTVVHGVTGLLIPTMQPQQGYRQALARYALHHYDYDRYIQRLMQEVVIDRQALIQALEQLIDHPERRRQMGQAGQKRAQCLYDWSVIGRQLREVADHLNQRRRQHSGAADEMDVLPCPSQQFQSWATRRMAPDCRYAVVDRRDPSQYHTMQRLAINHVEELSKDGGQLMAAILHSIGEAGGMNLQELSQILPTAPLIQLQHACHWLCKHDRLRVIREKDEHGSI